MTATSHATVECRRCGALNDIDFGQCIRCGAVLAGAAPAEGARRRVPAPGRRGSTVGQSEALFGRWHAEELPVAKALLAVNLIVFGIQLMISWRREPSFDALLLGGSVLDALKAGAMLTVPHLIAMEPWRLLSACFVHFGVIHIGMNMLALLHLCRLLEPAIGSVRILIAYVLTGVAGFAVSVAWYALAGQPAPTAGASGALFGLMGVILGFLLRRKDERWKRWAVQAVAFSLLFGFALPGINNSAHIGGLISGAVIGAMLGAGEPSPSRRWQRVLATLFALAIPASLVLARLSPLPNMLAQS